MSRIGYDMGMPQKFQTILPDVLLESVRSGRASLDYAMRVIGEPSQELARPFLEFMGGAGLDECVQFMYYENWIEPLAATYRAILGKGSVQKIIMRASGREPWFMNWEVYRDMEEGDSG